ncbi:MAG: bifunctional phosphoribosylaminoimidazolecarboxamide formyltransferase/IMP cyclohydrolase [Steroidobacteraceae bacterium]
MHDPAPIRIRRALLSASDKSGLVELARVLASFGVEIISTGATARLLASSGLAVREASAYTDFPEIMDGRVKTLHPRIHGGLLGRRGIDDAVMALNGIEPIDLLVVNLYPFEQTLARPDCRYRDAVEQIDIGGPAMIRAAAKNHEFVAVAVEPEDYTALAEELRANGGATSLATRSRLAAAAFAHTARYDALIASYLSARTHSGAAGFPTALPPLWIKSRDLRYGENPHQRAALYADRSYHGSSVASAEPIQGKALSFNNINDTDTAVECVRQFDEPACVLVKHAGPCGAAVAGSALEAYEAAYRADPTSAFGGIIALNRALEEPVASAILARQFAEVIAAPSISPEAAAVLAAKPGIRVLALGDLRSDAGVPRPQAASAPAEALEYRSVLGGLLAQTRDADHLTARDLTVATRREPTPAELDDLLFAWRVCRLAKSNAIVLARQRATLGIGAGQTSRVEACRIALMKADEERHPLAAAVMASDGFFPFRDGLDLAAERGIRAVIQPGGSRRDAEVVAAADEHGVAMVLTGIRHFRH